MKKGSSTKKAPAPFKKVSFETFRNLSGYGISQLKIETPTCFNGKVSIRKYRITIEEVEEPKEALIGRVQQLVSDCDNYHSWTPLMDAAAQLGVTLDTSDFGRNRKK